MNKLSLILVVILVYTQICFGQKVSSLKLSNRQSILNGRVFLSFPDSAKNMARPVDIMSADRNTNSETRIILDIGDKRLVFFAQELFLLGDAKILETITSEKNSDFEFLNKVLTNRDSILSILSTPTKWDNKKGGILINSLTVKTKDNTLIRIDAYINPSAFSEKDEFILLTENVFNTIEKGIRVNERKERVEKHKIFGTKKYFEFILPENFIIEIDQKYDFQVFKIKKYTKFGSDDFQNITIYSGFHPSFFHSEYGFDGYTELQKSNFLGGDVEWFYFADTERNLYLKEQKIPSDEIDEGLITHIAITSNKPECITELSKIIEGIKLINE